MWSKKLFAVAIVCCFVSFGYSIDTTNVYLSSNTTSASLDCSSTNPNETISWTIDGVSIESTESILEVSNYGKYVCTYNTTGAQKQFDVAKIGSTVVEQSHKSLTFNNGDENRQITCVNSDSSPQPDFVWFFRSETGIVETQITAENLNYVIETTANSTTLSFANLTYDSRGYYKCKASNVAGYTSSEILIRVKDRMAALYPFLGIVLEVVILITVIFVYEKRSQKKAATNEVVASKEESAPLKADDSDEIRLRSTRNNNSK